MTTFIYVAMCLVVPPVWGLISYWLFELIGSRRRPGPNPVAGEQAENGDAG